MPAALTDMPEILPVFPLSGVLLLPRGQLPLNIFEPRYIAMVEDAIKTDRMIGIIQPRQPETQNFPLYDTGCAGRIKSFSETDDGRYLITLTGISRFRVREELPQQRGYRRVRADWAPFKNDFTEQDCLDIDRKKLRDMLRGYFEMKDFSCDWDAIDGASDSKLITCLSMVCPFSAGEKQALLEAPCCRARAEKFMTLLKMALHSEMCDTACHH